MTDFIPGEPVLMQVNDYERGIFNGDQGIILNCSEYGNSTVAVVFQQSQGFAVFPVESLRSVLRHSYAMTVHKAQGSEFNRIALVLPDRDLPINTPEILYTASPEPHRAWSLSASREIFNSGVTRTVSAIPASSRSSAIEQAIDGHVNDQAASITTLVRSC